MEVEDCGLEGRGMLVLVRSGWILREVMGEAGEWQAGKELRVWDVDLGYCRAVVA